jgi:aryl-alcohol dehydrogenase-like predicted oxidoreductase
METRLLGASGLSVSVLSLGTATFGGQGTFFQAWGATDTAEARELVARCLDAGVNLFDTADAYSAGRSEEILGEALAGRRSSALIATKVFGRMGPGPNDLGLSRQHIIKACEDSLRRLRTDTIDLYQAHGFDALTPLEETLAAFDDLIRAGKVRYVGCSNYSGWHLMKALALWQQGRGARYVSQQVYYSLVARELEYELVPLGEDQGVGALIWSPLTAGFLTGKYRRDSSPDDTRWTKLGDPPITIPMEQAYRIIDVCDEIAQARGVSVAQVALNWLLCKPGVTSVIIGARNAAQLEDNLAAASWRLTEEEVLRLDAVSDVPAPYPYWHQRKYAAARNPLPRHTR